MQRPALTPERRLRLSLVLGLGYGLLNALAALWNASAWFAAVSCYYLLLSLLRLLPVLCIGYAPRKQLRVVRCVGTGMLGLSAVSGMLCFFALELGRAAEYPGHLIYGVAAYTFYALTAACIHLVRSRKQPLWQAVRALSVSHALVSLFFLENALLAAFGSGEPWQLPMQRATAAGAFLISAGMAVGLLRKKERA